MVKEMFFRCAIFLSMLLNALSRPIEFNENDGFQIDAATPKALVLNDNVEAVTMLPALKSRSLNLYANQQAPRDVGEVGDDDDDDGDEEAGNNIALIAIVENEYITLLNEPALALASSTQHLPKVKREVASDANAPADGEDDMELAEINVFRPVFRYRVAYSKQVKNPPQQFG